MSDDIKKYINLSNLYTEVQQDSNKQLDENWFTDKIKEIFGIDNIDDKQAQEINKAAEQAGVNTNTPPEDTGTGKKDNNQGQGTSKNVEPRPTESGQAGDYARNDWDQKYGATHNADGTPK